MDTVYAMILGGLVAVIVLARFYAALENTDAFSDFTEEDDASR